MRRIHSLVCLIAVLGCEGPAGPTGPAGGEGPSGPSGASGVSGPSGATGATGATGAPGQNGQSGDAGTNGQNGAAGCAGLAAGETPGVFAQITVSTPANNQFFAVGERAKATIVFSNRCTNPLSVDALGTASLYLYGPRQTALTKSANKLMNAIVDRNAADRQHHFINLKAPKFLDTTQTNLQIAADGTVEFTFAPVSDEAAGTYTLGIYARSVDERDQLFELAELQVGTATREEFASGATAASKCYDCHAIPNSEKASMHHIHPSSRSIVGSWAYDLYPIATCQACHNLDGYSRNSAVRKVHGLHRGHNQLAPGAAHAEYGMGADTTLAEYTNVGFPAMPMGERDCATCHADDRWKTRPTRLACGTCHDNLYFDTGTLNPVRNFGKPGGVSCANDTSCAAFGNFAVCNTQTGECERKAHPVQSDDAQCTVCHTADTGLSPIAAKHEIYARTRVRDLQLKNVVLYANGIDPASCTPAPKACGNGPLGAIKIRNSDGSEPGDVLKVRFTLTDGSGTPITTLRTASTLSGTLIMAGPTESQQRVFGPITVKSAGTLSCPDGESPLNSKNCVNGVYDYALPKQHSSSAGATGEFPYLALAPYNTVVGTPAGTPDATRPNPDGTYQVWLYINEAFSTPASFRDAANIILPFRAGTSGPIQPHEAVVKNACNSCHTTIQAHGGGRQDEGGACSMCHTKGALDRKLLTTGSSCTSDANCSLGSAFEKCLPSPLPTVSVPDPIPSPSPAPWPNTCVLVADPTPDMPIYMPWMTHQIHYARRLAGYQTRDYPINPGQLQYTANSNRNVNLSEILLPIDVRNCRVCHVDTKKACSSSNPCGYGQTCKSGVCVNNAFMNPSASVCLSCHDYEAAYSHAALNTFNGSETCSICHGEDDEFSVERMHNTIDPYKPPYQREKE